MAWVLAFVLFRALRNVPVRCYAPSCLRGALCAVGPNAAALRRAHTARAFSSSLCAVPRINIDKPGPLTISKGFSTVITFTLNEPIICEDPQAYCAVVVLLTNTNPKAVSINTCQVRHFALLACSAHRRAGQVDVDELVHAVPDHCLCHGELC